MHPPTLPNLLSTNRRNDPRRHAAVSMVLVAAAVLLAPAVAVAADQDDPLDQVVEADEATVEGPEVIDVGHVDLGPRFIDGVWRFQARDDRESPAVWRYPHDVVFQLTDAAILPAPDHPDYTFLDTEPGTPLHVVPQTQDYDVVWLGWNTQDPEVTERIDRGATLTLHDVDGPGRLLLFLQEGVSGEPNVLWDSAEGYPQDLWMEVNSHTHANWVFTEPGVYRLGVEMHADLLDETRGSDTVTLLFAVGDEIDPETVFAAQDVDPVDNSTSNDQDPIDNSTSDDEDSAVAGGAADPPAGSFNTVLVAVAVGAVALVLVIIAVVVAGRRTRAAAENPDPGGTR